MVSSPMVHAHIQFGLEGLFHALQGVFLPLLQLALDYQFQKNQIQWLNQEAAEHHLSPFCHRFSLVKNYPQPHVQETGSTSQFSLNESF